MYFEPIGEPLLSGERCMKPDHFPNAAFADIDTQHSALLNTKQEELSMTM